MKAVLFGDHPRSEWSAEPGVMPVLTDSLLGAIKARHDLVLGQFGHLQTQELIRHFEVGHNVFESQFEDGTLVRADFVNEELFVNEKYIARPAALAGSSGLGIQLEAVHV